MNKKIQKIAVLGGGPSGSALACHLVRQGREVVVFDDGHRPELIVGESLVPATLPLLDRLGVREKVAAIGQHKPGVTFDFGTAGSIAFDFQAVKHCGLPTFAYNVPRPAFDHILRQQAITLGARIIPQRVPLEREGPDRVKLPADAAALAFRDSPPDLIIDATGRSRAIARLLDLPARTGPREDVAHFAHYHGFTEENPRGQVIISRLAAGWSWRIPLPDRLSVGIVVPRDAAARLGANPAERLEAAIAQDPTLSMAGKNRQQISRVMTYTNYQLITTQGHGPGWVMAGDAFGFVDPMLSPGLMLALHSAEMLATHLEEPAVYAAKMTAWLEAWQELISYFYNGKMPAMYHTGMAIERKHPGLFTRFMHRHMERNIACMASGASTLSAYSRGLVRFMSRHGIRGTDPAAFAIP